MNALIAALRDNCDRLDHGARLDYGTAGLAGVVSCLGMELLVGSG